MGEFRVQDKEPKKKTNIVVGSVQSFEGFSNNHHHRSFFHNHDSSSASAADADGYGPTTYNMSFGGDSSALGANAIIDNGGVSLNFQPFHNISASNTTLKAGGMAASIGIGYPPFTSAQWRELERQAMIYKYLMASLPVPSHLLSLDGGFNLRLSNRNNTDPEAGRCKRTDGKKWRCSKDVALNNRYCERHMHRGRPRSRKPVELHTNNNSNSHHQIKKARCDSNPFSVPDFTVAVPNPTTRKYGSSSHFLASTPLHPYLQSSLSLHNSSFEGSNKQPRGLEWMLNGDPISLGASNSGWNPLMHNNKLGMTNESSYHNNTESQYLNSFPLYNSSELAQHEKPFPLLLNPLVVPMQTLQSEKPRGFSFIDAWSNTETVENNANTTTTSNNGSASVGKLSLSSLDLSMGGSAVSEEMSTIEMNAAGDDDSTKIALSNWLNSAQPWLGSTPGGPLAEVLRPSNVTSISDATNSNPSSPLTTTNRVESIGTSGTGMVSSPSGVLHNKTLASFSDSSGNSSPNVASSRANSEIALLNKFNHISYVN
ncbi:growth-regulating factor 3 isoform X2 [Medicago truncatula]|uniref:Growth-regulating factor n=1 Tax=Medicago truncatula TaxID=3880 RepID=G7J891_MEDTR|nr:growth-regulating factor 3 isoform X2 [Medicago truncatula]AES72589.1 growth-regulating factor [Medicago truncatula]